MSESDKWMNLCDPNCQQKSVFPNCSLCDIALEIRTALAEGRLEAIPPADVRPVVLCKDCKHKGWIQEPCHGKSIDYCRILERVVDRMFFCAAGEPKDGDAE